METGQEKLDRIYFIMMQNHCSPVPVLRMTHLDFWWITTVCPIKYQLLAKQYAVYVLSILWRPQLASFSLVTVPLNSVFSLDTVPLNSVFSLDTVLLNSVFSLDTVPLDSVFSHDTFSLNSVFFFTLSL